MRELKNREEVVKVLASMLRGFDVEMNSFETDVYLYYNAEEKTAELDTFVNAGGNSWLNDDHETIYRDDCHFDSMYEVGFQSISDLAEAVGLSEKELIAKTADFLGFDEDDDLDEIDYWDVVSFIKSDCDLSDKVKAAFAEWIDEQGEDYESKADDIIREWEESEPDED